MTKFEIREEGWDNYFTIEAATADEALDKAYAEAVESYDPDHYNAEAGERVEVEWRCYPLGREASGPVVGRVVVFGEEAQS